VLSSLDSASVWLGSDSLTAAELGGREVLVDFWTYSCVNWLRTLPYVNAWHERYRDYGLVVIGVHAPEFGFEHDLENVRHAVADLDVRYPVVIDNDFVIWRAFENHYWPAVYLVDGDGDLRYYHFGEGSYEDTERAIQDLLGTSDDLVPIQAGGLAEAAGSGPLKSPETYLGDLRSERRSYQRPDSLELNEWALFGDWSVGGEAAVLDSPGGSIAYRFDARDVNLVLAPPASGDEPVSFTVRLDGEAPGNDHGLDVAASGNGTLSVPRMYQLVRRRDCARQPATFEVSFDAAGVALYVFTFG
jgi:thiol-disulfide isomerase/thioredoxin